MVFHKWKLTVLIEIGLDRYRYKLESYKFDFVIIVVCESCYRQTTGSKHWPVTSISGISDQIWSVSNSAPLTSVHSKSRGKVCLVAAQAAGAPAGLQTGLLQSQVLSWYYFVWVKLLSL